jgi:hypothetical protein
MQEMTQTILTGYKKAGIKCNILEHLKFVPTVSMTEEDTKLSYGSKEYSLSKIGDTKEAAEKINADLEAKGKRGKPEEPNGEA